jgi:hypothetical protein
MAVVQPLIIALNMVLIVWAFRVVDSLDAADEHIRKS